MKLALDRNTPYLLKKTKISVFGGKVVNVIKKKRHVHFRTLDGNSRVHLIFGVFLYLDVIGHMEEADILRNWM